MSDYQEHFSRFANDWVLSAYGGVPKEYPLALERNALIVELLKELPIGSRVLDLGCGPGILANQLAGLGHNVVGVDFSLEMLSLAKDEMDPDHPFELVADDIHHFLENCEVADAIVAAGVIYYQTEATEILAKISSKLKPGGLALVSFRNREFKRSSNLLANQVSSLSRSLSPNAWASWVERAVSALVLLGGRSAPLQTQTISAIPSKSSHEPPIQAAQHSEEEIRKESSSLGLFVEEIRGIHPHLLHPALDDDSLAPFTDSLSSELSLVVNPELRWFSHFLCKFRKS